MDKKKEKKGIVYPKSKKPYVRRGVLEMTKIVSEIEAGLISKKGACFKYGLCRGTLRLFLQQQAIRNLVKYSALPDKQINMPDTQQTLILNKLIQQLTKDLEFAKLKIAGLETLINVAEANLNIRVQLSN